MSETSVVILIGFIGMFYFMQRWIDARVRKGIEDHERTKTSGQ